MTEIKHTLEALVNPFFLIIVFLLFALYFSWQIVWARRLLMLSVLLLVVFSTSLLPAYLTRTLEQIYPNISQINPDIKTIVVLSGGQADTDELPAEMVLNTASIRRLLTGIRLWKAIPNAKLILSGGGYGHQIPEAEWLNRLANQCGVPNQAILTEDQSLNTAAQASMLKDRVGDKPFYLVTSAIHMPRSMALFSQQAMHPIAAPTDVTTYWQDERWQKRYIPNAHNFYYTEIALHEYLGLIVLYVRKAFA